MALIGPNPPTMPGGGGTTLPMYFYGNGNYGYVNPNNQGSGFTKGTDGNWRYIDPIGSNGLINNLSPSPQPVPGQAPPPNASGIGTTPSIGMSPVANSQTNAPLTVQALGNMLSNPQTPTSIPMTAPSANNALQNQFFQTPAYQLYNGQNAGSMNPLQNFRNSAQYQQAYGPNANSANPAVNFANDPGVQLAVQQGMIPLMNNYASRGLGQSGALSQALSQYMYNNYNQYVGGQNQMLNNYQNTNNSLFGNYQNQLAALTQFGAANSGSQNAFNAGTNLANIQSNNNMATGQNLSNANLVTAQNLGQANISAGENISTLLANQGMANAGAILNTGAAQSNNLFQGMSLLAQLNANQQASNAQSQNSIMQQRAAQQGMANTGMTPRGDLTTGGSYVGTGGQTSAGTSGGTVGGGF